MPISTQCCFKDNLWYFDACIAYTGYYCTTSPLLFLLMLVERCFSCDVFDLHMHLDQLMNILLSPEIAADWHIDKVTSITLDHLVSSNRLFLNEYTWNKSGRLWNWCLERPISLYIKKKNICMQLESSSSPTVIQKVRFPSKINAGCMTGRIKQSVQWWPHRSMLMAQRLRMLAVHIITSRVTKMSQWILLKRHSPTT